ncbi:flagellar protein FlaG [Brevibacillus brevis]|uniref:Flagellar protein FlaG n=1 Tax=Brevibacillus brevis TaxID=1393 RepID=A0A517IET3_BREBE|nr:flagellar protein FlaG [Brevibacillus brevis]QDS37401.1 flagellar protein FlaG [Brevibacillus brevis]
MEISSVHSLPGQKNNMKQGPGTTAANEQSTTNKQAELNPQTKSDLQNEIAGINKWLQSTNTHVKFTLHEDLNEYYVQVINDQTNEVIREIPSKKMMDMVAKMHEMIGLLVDEKR